MSLFYQCAIHVAAGYLACPQIGVMACVLQIASRQLQEEDQGIMLPWVNLDRSLLETVCLTCTASLRSRPALQVLQGTGVLACDMTRMQV